jgi:hypothetical protein
MMSAMTYIGVLMEEEKLPGYEKGIHGTFSSVPQPLPEGGKPLVVLELVVRAQYDNKKDEVFWYSLKRETHDAPWNLVDAWKTDLKGKREEVPVP